jgi:hypothetical protein
MLYGELLGKGGLEGGLSRGEGSSRANKGEEGGSEHLFFCVVIVL